jgi:hypothetical protein
VSCCIFPREVFLTRTRILILESERLNENKSLEGRPLPCHVVLRTRPAQHFSAADTKTRDSPSIRFP